MAPECVEADEIQPGATAQECALNARYAVSCAHKMGCQVFVSTYDIVEVQPNQMLCLIAAAMAVDMKRRWALSNRNPNPNPKPSPSPSPSPSP